MTIRTVTTSLAFAVLTLGIAACGDAAAQTAAPVDVAEADVTVVTDDTVFVDPPNELPAGTSVIAVDNQGRAPHDITVEGIHGATVAADGGETAAGEVALEPGVYTVYCSVSGHRSAGMEFQITVTE